VAGMHTTHLYVATSLLRTLTIAVHVSLRLGKADFAKSLPRKTLSTALLSTCVVGTARTRFKASSKRSQYCNCLTNGMPVASIAEAGAGSARIDSECSDDSEGFEGFDDSGD
jgi:hypothetical protein